MGVARFKLFSSSRQCRQHQRSTKSNKKSEGHDGKAPQGVRRTPCRTHNTRKFLPAISFFRCDRGAAQRQTQYHFSPMPSARGSFCPPISFLVSDTAPQCPPRAARTRFFSFLLSFADAFDGGLAATVKQDGVKRGCSRLNLFPGSYLSQ